MSHSSRPSTFRVIGIQTLMSNTTARRSRDVVDKEVEYRLRKPASRSCMGRMDTMFGTIPPVNSAAMFVRAAALIDIGIVHDLAGNKRQSKISRNGLHDDFLL